MKALFSLLFLTSFLFASDALNYVNNWRINSGLQPFKIDNTLSKAALNHSKYNALNPYSGHYETPRGRYFTGKMPRERVRYVKHPSSIVAENVSMTQTELQGVEGLMSAIYHRFGFLHFEFDEIGMGKALRKDSVVLTFLMGNSFLSRTCQKDRYNDANYYYLDLCLDPEKKVSATTYEKNKKQVSSKAPNFVIYPYPNAKEVPPVFYEEQPDPLPRY
ncbi:MAG: CAP domain-containing protein, partial [Thiovulaceae bacterium]|nr:CAP domain-containing protein [Sulfurimonadaceae bacterium]